MVLTNKLSDVEVDITLHNLNEVESISSCNLLVGSICIAPNERLDTTNGVVAGYGIVSRHTLELHSCHFRHHTVSALGYIISPRPRVVKALGNRASQGQNRW